jgi:hypothetical protein
MNDSSDVNSSGYYTPESNSLNFVTPTDGPPNANMLEASPMPMVEITNVCLVPL